MKNYAFIFARGGSKGLPRKNIKELAGKPLIAYSIDVALKCPSIQHVFVSTEDNEISQISASYGATIINRPIELASDNSPEWLSWIHAIEWVQRKHGGFDNFVCLPATSPLRNIRDVESAISKLATTNADFCISITPANRSPFFNMVVKDSADFVELVIKPDAEVTRRQDAPTVFDITTVVYAASTQFITANSKVFDGKVTSIQVPKERAIDIDDVYDFKLAEAIILRGGE